jgi:type I restriction enzyme, S subunit
MSELKVYRLGELICDYNAGRRPIKSSERTPGSTPYYGASGVVDRVQGHTHDGDFLLISEDGENLRSRATPIAFLARGKIWVNNHAHVVAGRQPADTRFLSYALSIADISGYLTGSAQPKLSKSAMESIRLLLPPPAARVAIAEVLGALDDKIASNGRTIAAAEDLMTLRVAGSQSRTAVRDVARQSSEIVPPDSFDPLVSHFSLPAFDTERYPEVSVRERIRSNKFVLKDPVVLMSKLNPRIPRVWDVTAVPEMMAVASTEFVVLVPVGVSTSELWAATSQPSVVTELANKVSGTSGSHQRVMPAEILGLVIPDPRHLNAAARAEITSLGAVVHARRLESRRLAATRDELLPLLMSGEVRLKDAERAVGEVL